ncbi:App1 family protein [Rhodanobacter aciditrophus]|uniref:App1 family protein n=1 Tax=Rhodanobacter aciditrophus TaxID=1623218 RepID=A0ABW4B2U2_9GAMM
MQKTTRRLLYRSLRRCATLIHRYKRWRGYSPVTVQPYMTYGTSEELWVAGRLLEAKGIQGHIEDSNWKNFLHMMRRYRSSEIPFTRINITLEGEVHSAKTDAHGYFHYHWKRPAKDSVKQPWTELMLQPTDAEIAKAQPYTIAEVSVPNDNVEFGVVSDVDDTIMQTGATSFLRHAKTVLLNNAHSRVLLPGTSEFYKALQKGVSGKANNPFYYVSSSPWNIYDLIAEFIHLNGLPKGPVLLKDFGLREDRWFKSGHESYKTGRIEAILKTYPSLKLVLIGDSGQKDVYAYLQVAKDFPDRILAVYIRDLTPDNRSEKMMAAVSEYADYQVPFAFIRDAGDAVEHARSLNLVTHEAAEKVKQDAEEDQKQQNDRN